jgi:DNA-binding response OmpR family regulator
MLDRRRCGRSGWHKYCPRALVIEDCERLAAVLAGALAEEGFETMVARSLREARAVVSRDSWSERSCSHVVLDLLLPDGLGLELLPALKRLVPAPAIVAISGHFDDHRALELARYSIPMLPKPFAIENLLEALALPSTRNAPAAPGIAEFCTRYGLTPREREVLEAWIAGYARKQLDDVLGMSASSAGTLWGRLCKRVGCTSQEEVVQHLVRVLLGRERLRGEPGVPRADGKR